MSMDCKVLVVLDMPLCVCLCRPILGIEYQSLQEAHPQIPVTQVDVPQDDLVPMPTQVRCGTCERKRVAHQRKRALLPSHPAVCFFRHAPSPQDLVDGGDGPGRHPPGSHYGSSQHSLVARADGRCFPYEKRAQQTTSACLTCRRVASSPDPLPRAVDVIGYINPACITDALRFDHHLHECCRTTSSVDKIVHVERDYFAGQHASGEQ